MTQRLPYTLLFIGITLGVMMGLLRPYLVETAQLTPFLTTRVFAHEMGTGSSLGWLYYAASFLQSCLARPWLGATLLVGILVAVAYTMRWAFRLSNPWFGLCWVLPFLLLTRYTGMGYLIYIAKSPAYAFAPALMTLIGLFLIGIVWHLCWKRSLLPTKKGKRGAVLLSILCFIGSGYYFWQQTYKDTNFLATLQMKQAAEEGNWEQVLQVSRANQEIPTRLQVCLTRLALYKTGQMGDQLFAYPDGAATPKAPLQQQWLRLMGAPLLYYHYGKTGFAYRWAMEDLVEYGMRPSYLRTMHRVAILNGETALADKYADALRHTLFYKEKTEDIEREAQEIRPLLNYTDQLDGDNGLVEFYLLQSFALMEGGSRQMVELSLMCSLITKQFDQFWPRFMALLPTWKDGIPRHYQEAALMVAQLQGGVNTDELPIDDSVRQRFARLVEASAQLGDNAGNAYRLRPEFGDTYWYYYFFVEGLKTS